MPPALKPIKVLDIWDFLDTKLEYRYPVGTITVPELSQNNFEMIVRRLNELIERVNAITPNLD